MALMIWTACLLLLVVAAQTDIGRNASVQVNASGEQAPNTTAGLFNASGQEAPNATAGMLLSSALAPPACRCRSGQSCFDEAPWDDLSQVGVQVADIVSASVMLRGAENDPLWLVDQPGHTYYSGMMGSPSQPGWMITNSTPAKYAELHSADEASQALQFASKHKLALVVKSTGHDFFGRSVSKGSFLLWTHKMTSTEWHESFTPQGCTTDAGSAVSLGAGVQFWQLYQEAAQRELKVVGGTCLTVGHVGFTLGGGYGDASRMYGSGATNLVEAEVVLADGRVVIANKCNDHTDLFRALRGGGGAFGLVTKATYRTYPKPSFEGHIHGRISGDATEGLTKFLAWYAAVVEQGLAKHFGSMLFIRENDVMSEINTVGLSLKDCSRIAKPLGLPCTASSQSWPPPEVVRSNVVGVEGWVDDWEVKSSSSYHTQSLSRYFRLDHIRTDGLRQEFSQTLVRIAKSLGGRSVILSLNYGLGHGSETALRDVVDTTVHPDVATAIGTVKLDLTVAHDKLGQKAASDHFAVDQKAYANHVSTRSQLDALLVGSGSYYNEGDYSDEDWQNRYWGFNYAELKRTKSKYDPGNVFTCHQCVGSDAPACSRRLSAKTTEAAENARVNFVIV
ncbi:unnamed protein product [Polarella glacialis]|uniref:FAD-binding PCMH-type domain-containing protein n=1 Tax=Polarella glacialis TaxID=89957 RepID=A0A813LVZ3_POLGL|nr:unnamed protein product [Polarella glacialis]